jgi:hypothetical protein
MTTPLKYAAHLAQGVDASARVAVPINDDVMYHRDVAWASEAVATSKTPTKLRQEIAAAQATVHQNHSRASNAARGHSSVLLKTQVVDAISHCETLLDDAAFRVQRARDHGKTSVGASIEALRVFDEQSKYLDPVGFTVQRLVNETQIATDRAFQERYGSTIVLTEPERYLSVFEVLGKRSLSDVDAKAMRSRIESSFTKPLLPTGDGGIPDLLLAMNAFTQADALATVRRKLGTWHEDIARLNQEIEVLTVKATQRRAEEDLEGADTCEGDALKRMQRVFELHLACLAYMSDSQSSNGGLLGQLEAIINPAAIQRLKEEQVAFRAQAIEDGATLDRFRALRHRNHQQAIASYESAVHRSYERLERNSFSQDKVWEEVTRCMDRLQELRRDAADTVSDHCRLTEAEHKRRKEHSEFLESFENQREYLKLLGENTGAAVQFLESLKLHVDSARDTIRQLKTEEKVAALCADERAALNSQYTSFSGRLVRRLHTFDARVANCERQRHEVDFLVKQALSTDDPDERKHLARSDTLIRQLEELRARAASTQVQFERDQQAYFTAVQHFEDFNVDDNPAVKALRLRAALRDQYTASLNSLAESQKHTSNEIKARVDQHEDNAKSVRELTEKKRLAKTSNPQ